MLLGLQTLFGRPRGFFIPHRYANDAGAPGRRPRYDSVDVLLRKVQPDLEHVIDDVDEFGPSLLEIGRDPPPAPRWQQDWFPRLDAAVAYTIIRRHRPARLIEVGSGHSTRFFARAAADAGYSLQLTAIDPQPRADITTLARTMMPWVVQGGGLDVFEALGAGDVLSIDSSHVLMPGTDVDYLINRVLPRLPAGVLVHIHDIFLPEDYPADWAWRGYNEQLAVAALLQGGGWRIRWSSRFALSALRERLARSVVARLPLVPGAVESSLWLSRCDGDQE